MRSQPQHPAREWWQTCAMSEFVARLRAMPRPYVVETVARCAGAEAAIRAQLEGDHLDYDQRRRTHQALGWMVERHALARAYAETTGIDEKLREHDARIRALEAKQDQIRDHLRKVR